jgi:hypothetical protein
LKAIVDNKIDDVREVLLYEDQAYHHHQWNPGRRKNSLLLLTPHT